MKNKLQILITLFLLVFTINSNIMAQYSGGTGIAADPYEISTLNDLGNLGVNSGDWDKYFIQIADIDASSVSSLDRIGLSSSSPFSGSYDGQGHTISNVTINESSSDNVGLFGYISSATIKNFHLTNVQISGNQFVGGFGGTVISSIIEDCSVTGSVTSDSSSVGGFVGNLTGSFSIKRCYSECTVIGGAKRAGGFVGYNSGTIEECYSTGAVTTTYTGPEAENGGFVGTNKNGSILKCFATGNVDGNGNNHIGGFAGYNYNGSIELSYSTGDVSNGNERVGGFAGENFRGTGSAVISRCYSEGDVSGRSTVGGFIGQLYNAEVNNCYSLGNVTKTVSFGSSYAGFCGNINNASIIKHCYSTGSVNYTSGAAPTDKGFVGNESSFTGSYDANFFNTTTSNQSTGTGATGQNHDNMNDGQTFVGQSSPNTNWDIVGIQGAGSNNYWEMVSGINSGYPFIRAEYSTPTNTPTAITANSATCGGNVFATGSKDVTERGVCWSTSQNPTIAGSKTSDGTTTGVFTSSITSLSASTTYYVRAYVTNNVGTSYGDEETITTTPATPVELTSFEAKSVGESVVLNWQTATEVNNYGFEVERASIRSKERNYSADEWEMIGFVDGHGNSNSPKEYSFIDTDKLSGTVQYRLKQIDINGAFEYHDVVTVELNGKMEYKLAQNHPNPFNPSTQISFTIPSAGMVKLSVYNLLGEVVSELVNKNLEAGTHQYNFDASNLTSGIYFYSISVNGFTQVKKMNLIK